MSCQLLAFTVACLLTHRQAAAAGENRLDVLPDRLGKVRVSGMMKAYLDAKAKTRLDSRRRRFDELVDRGTEKDLASHQETVRRAYLDALGGFEGFPDRATPLSAKVTGTIVKDGYRVEKILFESQPGHYVTCALFLPTDTRHRGGRLPAVLLVSGHSREAKGYASYQKGAALAAIQGLAVFAVDPIEQGERVQIGNRWGTSAHIAMGVGSILVGRSTATYEIWDNMRAIDYLVGRRDIDPDCIGVMGNSGGGTQSAQLLPADARIKAAAPASYITSLRRVFESVGPGDSEQHQFGELVYGKDHVEYLTMRAPTPVLIAANKRDFFPIDGTRDTYGQARRLFARLGAQDRIALVENDGKHGWHRPLREASVAWMLRWLRGEKRQITEPEDLPVLSAGEIRVTRTGQVRDLPGYVSTYALNAAYDREVLAPRRGRIWRGDRASALARVRELANVRPLAQLPRPRSQVKETLPREGYSITKVILTPEDGIVLPGLLFEPRQKRPSGATLYLNARGKAAEAGGAGPIERLVSASRVVLALDLRGIGETRGRKNTYRSQDFAQPYHEIYVAYGLGVSFVGMRAEDILVAARWLLGRKGLGGTRRVDLVAKGNDVGIPALHAAALERGLFGRVVIEDVLESWAGALDRPVAGLGVNAVHAALSAYDLPDLRAAARPGSGTPKP